MDLNKTDDLYERARRRAKHKVAFYSHFMTYVLVIGFLLAIDLLQNQRLDWAYWPALGWGIGLLSHAANAFVTRDALYQRLLQQELDALQRQNGGRS